MRPPVGRLCSSRFFPSCRRFSLPVLLVQHISPGFSKGFVDWLNRTSNLRVDLASSGETAVPGRVYVAPDALQMKVDAAAG